MKKYVTTTVVYEYEYLSTFVCTCTRIHKKVLNYKSELDYKSGFRNRASKFVILRKTGQKTGCLFNKQGIPNIPKGIAG